MLYENFIRLTFPKMCIFPNKRIYFDGGNQQFMINFFSLVHSDPIYKTDVGENMQLYVITKRGQFFAIKSKIKNIVFLINLKAKKVFFKVLSRFNEILSAKKSKN